MSLMQRYFLRGLPEVSAEVKDSVKQTKLEIARKLLVSGLDPSYVASVTGLSLAEIQNLKATT